jgi:Kef-type K+ transport system membrane component KefB
VKAGLPGQQLLRVVYAAFNLVVAGVLLWTGTDVFLTRRPNVWLASGVGLFLLTWAFDFLVRVARPRIDMTLLRRLRVRYAGLLVAICLCGVGSAIHGEAIGVIGAFGAFIVGSWCLWLVQQLSKTG